MGAPAAVTIDDAVARMQAIAAALPAADGVACFNRMYLGVTDQVRDGLARGEFANPRFMETLDVTFANLYFDAYDASSEPGAAIPAAWQPLFAERGNAELFAIQFALAGMNAHINYDLPIAVVQTCRTLGSAPDAGSNHADYQKVDALLDAAEQSVRQSFESGDALHADRDVQGLLDLLANWSINTARDVAWDTAVALWRCRDVATVEDLLMGSLGRTVAMASRCLLVAH